jgi:predicted ester cyclase
MFRLKDGRIVEHWANRDDVQMIRQLGILAPAASLQP